MTQLRSPQILLLGVIASAGLLFALTAGAYEVRLMTLAGIYSIAVLGYQLAIGHAGVLSLAQGAFFGVGAYVTGILTTQYNVDGAAAMLAGMLVAGVLAAVVAIPVLRLQTHYFALATLAIAEVVHLTAVNWTAVTGGANGIYGVPPLVFLGINIGFGWPLFAAVWITAGLAAAMVYWRTGGRRQPRLDLAREAPLAADAIGINRRQIRFELFVLSAVLGATAGGFQAHAIGVVSPAVTDFTLMVTLLVAALVGGQRRIIGALIGGILVIHLPEWFRSFDVFYLIAYGAALLLVIILAPNGIAGFWPKRRLRDAAPGLPQSIPQHHRSATLQAQGLVKKFGGITAVDGIDINLTAGQITGIIGPNGSGKSTLLNLLTGLIKADRGGIMMNDQDLTPYTADGRARRGLARTFQHPELVPGHSVWETVIAGLPMTIDGPTAAAKTALALDKLSLRADSAVPTDLLSPESLRRLEIARALANGPRVLLLDEPAAGLSAAEQDRLALSLQSLADEGLTIVVVEHGMRFLMPLADVIICLDQGKVIATASPAAISENPHVIDCYLGRDNTIAKAAPT